MDEGWSSTDREQSRDKLLWHHDLKRAPTSCSASGRV
jgi:hypothetical protein